MPHWEIDTNTSDEETELTPPRFERLVSEIASRFINVSAEKIDEEIERALKLVVEFQDVDRGTIFQFSEGKKKLIRTHFWSKITQQPYQAFHYNTEDLPWTTQKILKGETIIFSHLEDLPRSANVDRQVLGQYGILSSVMIPLTINGAIVGSFALSTLKKTKTWESQFLDSIKAIASIFSSAIARKMSEEALKLALRELEKVKEQLDIENSSLRKHEGEEKAGIEMIGESPIFFEAVSRAKLIADTDVTVLILGETGTGKSMLARLIHHISYRKNRPFVLTNCPSLPPSLIESELFGYERGAFTGAERTYVGRFELANNSTLCLEEITEIPLRLQAKLLRVVETGEFERVGSTVTRRTNARLIVTTNRDLKKEVMQGRFRPDLFYRLNVFPIYLPPLRKRKEDIPLLVQTYVEYFCRKYGRRPMRVERDVIDLLMDYDYPGNVRELVNIIERAVIMSTGCKLRVSRDDYFFERLNVVGSNSENSYLCSLAEAERNHILNVLFHTNWRIEGKRGAAKILGLSPSTLRYRMRKLGIDRKTTEA